MRLSESIKYFKQINQCRKIITNIYNGHTQTKLLNRKTLQCYVFMLLLFVWEI